MDCRNFSEAAIARIMTFEDGDPEENPWVTGQPLVEEIQIETYSPEWPQLFESSRDRIANALPGIAISIEHIGSTAVPGLAAKPVIDIDLIVSNPEQEEKYVPALVSLGYELTIREKTWYQHRVLRHNTPRVNLHVFGPECPEHIRHILFRNWLCDHAIDRQRYVEAKLTAKNSVTTMQDYNQNKQELVRDIYRNIFKYHGWINGN